MINRYFEGRTKFLVGDKAINNLPYELALLNCKKVLVVSDEPAYRLGNVDMIYNAFKLQDIIVEYVYKNIDSIATTIHCENIAKLYKSKNCDCIIAVGRKGAICAAKGAKVLLMDGSSTISNFEGKTLDNNYSFDIPLVVIPINVGSGVECSNFVRVYDVEKNRIFEIDSIFALSNFVVVDSQMTDTMPPKAIATFGLYALSMAVETFVDEDTLSIAKSYADVAIKLVYDYLKKCMLKNADIKYRTKIMEAVVLASAGYSALERDLLAILSDAISDRYKINYANVFVILFRHYIKTQSLSPSFGYCLNAMIDIDDYALFAKQSRSQKALLKIEELFDTVNEYVDFNTKLSTFNIPEDELILIANEVANIAQRPEDEILDLLKVAY